MRRLDLLGPPASTSGARRRARGKFRVVPEISGVKTRFLLLAAGLALTTLVTSPSVAEPPVKAGVVANAPVNPFSLGPLTLGMSEDDVEKAIGEPATRSDPRVDDMSGEQTHAVQYANGVSLTYSDDIEVAGPGKLIAISLDEPADWLGVGGLQLGMTSEQARSLVKSMVGGNVQPFPMESPDDVAVIFGETYTILQVRCTEGRVSSISLGPAPE